VKPKILSWNLKGLTLYVYKNLNKSFCQGLLCVVAESINMWICIICVRVGLLKGSCYCAFRGW